MRYSFAWIFCLLAAVPVWADAPANVSGLQFLVHEAEPLSRPIAYGSRVMNLQPSGAVQERWATSLGHSAGPRYFDPRSGEYTYARLSSTTARLTLTFDGTPTAYLLEFDEESWSGRGRAESSPFEGLWFRFAFREPAAQRDGLLNVSTRLDARIGSPAFVGFVLGGKELRSLLIRAVGPGLAAFQVPTPAPEPAFDIVGSNFTLGFLGADWAQDEAAQQANDAAATAAGAFPLDPESSDVSHVLVLPPGAYSLVVDPRIAAQAGSVLLEVYELP